MLKFVFAPLVLIRNTKKQSAYLETVCAVLGYTLICKWNVLPYNESHCNLVATETALDRVIIHIEKSVENGEVTKALVLQCIYGA
jgi:hypothetical protein